MNLAWFGQMVRMALLVVATMLTPLSFIACTATGAGAGGSAGSGGDTSSGGGEPCGNTTCSKDSFCQSSAQACGVQNAQFTIKFGCAAIPKTCPDIVEPVCGCDSKVYSNWCLANTAGVDVGGTCNPPAGTFQCGPEFCPTQGHYCEVDQGYTGTRWACLPTQPGCNGSCSCIAKGCPLSPLRCEQGSAGGITVFCTDG